ncbi:MAG: UDP-N-acetylmuramoyl-L-alanyl-D-glutamate--2,6-diaminopimelate ligase [Flammeovirgaceae bacterium]
MLEGLPTLGVEGSLERAFKAIQFDSRKVESDDVFVAIKGLQADGHQYINQVIQKGAAAVIYSDGSALPPQSERGQTVFVQVENPADTMGKMAAAYYEHPSKKLKLVGITGTNGKTTTVTLWHQLFKELGYQVGLISTIENKINDEVLATKFTTPDSITINQLLDQMVKAGCQFCFMEVSSHALVQGRVAGLHFTGAAFSNISHDHLDFHRTFAEYIKAKKLFFDNLPKESFALVNKDDRRWNIMLQNCDARHYTYALKSMADFKGRLLGNTFEGLQMEINQREVWFRLIGDFNAYNLLGVYGAAVLLGEDEEEVLKAMSEITPAKGRFEQLVLANQVRCVVDYAHTPDALKNVLETIRQIQETGERIITVVGCGGNRDAAKRPKMAAIAAKLSDKVILTSDNPRFENPMAIIKDMESGLSISEKVKTISIEDRKEAIEKAVTLAEPGDVVLVAGKGHENYQEIEGKRYHFDDLEVLKGFR